MILLSILLFLSAANPGNAASFEEVERVAAAPSLPRFEDYATERSTSRVRLKIATGSPEWDYRTRFRRAERDPTDFSANGVLVLWGCGTQCLTGAWIDRTSGRIKPLPVAGEDYLELDLDSRAGSNLILSTWLEPKASEPVCMFGAHVWTGKRFTEVLGYPVRVLGRCPVSYTYR